MLEHGTLDLSAGIKEQGEYYTSTLLVLTFQQLEDFQIPYDEIYFGRPPADFYIQERTG